MAHINLKKDPAFFETFKTWISEHGGTFTDQLYTRSTQGEQSRGITIQPQGKAVASALFIHGTGNDITYPSISLYKVLFKQNIRIYAFDLDGHGYKGSSLFSQQMLPTFVTWAVAQTEISANEPLFLIGHSLGGTLALAHAVQASKTMQGLILISAPLTLSATFKSLAAESLSWLRPSLWQERKVYGTWGILPALGSFKRASFPIRLTYPEVNYVLQVNDAVDTLALDLISKLDSISCPVLLIYGTADHIVKEQNAFDIQKRVKKSEVLSIKGATHFSTIFESEVSNRIGSFIRAHIR